MNAKDFFKTVNQICDEYKIEHGIVEKQATITVQVPKFQEGQALLWSGKDAKIRGVGDTVYCKDLDAIITITDISKDYIYYVLNGDKGRTTPKSLSFAPPKSEPVDRPAPKFAKGDMTNKGEIKEVIWGKSGWLCTTIRNGFLKDWWESQLTAKPAITITLFKVVNGKVETENTHRYMPYRDNNEEATLAFNQGFCAILIDDGKTRQRRYCPEIEAVLEFIPKNSWHDVEYKREIIPGIINAAINSPKWTVESHGVVMRTYQKKDGVVVNVEGYPDDWFFKIDDPILKALGFNESNIMSQILSGKE